MPRPAPISSETAFRAQVLKLLKKEYRGWWMVVHEDAISGAGVPDIVGCYLGRFVGIELKRPDGKGILSPLQVATIEEIGVAGGVAFSAHTLAFVREMMGVMKEAYG